MENAGLNKCCTIETIETISVSMITYQSVNSLIRQPSKGISNMYQLQEFLLGDFTETIWKFFNKYTTYILNLSKEQSTN